MSLLTRTVQFNFYEIGIFHQALIKFQLETSTELTKRQITKVVMAIGSGEEG